ncbi:MAG: DUF721 domain-containing protein [Phocaeicola sp.]|uniref:DUF721 domain-containing protein n=1 Tax=Phocaeicola TaxID=909656 RepID=UPI00234F0920|nr:DUF721 domain-containing protein [Phocaeicola oris]MCE2615670.1 DUF721 domain-containing protein [Phocaeicola oris]
MERNKAQNIGNLVMKFLRMQGLEAPLNEHRLINSWGEVVGSVIVKYTTDLFIKNQTLHVHVTSAPLRQELMMARKILVKSLNEKVGSQVIVDIIFH